MSDSKARVARDERLAREREAAIKERAGDLAVVAALLYWKVTWPLTLNEDGSVYQPTSESAAVSAARRLLDEARSQAAEEINLLTPEEV